MRFETLERVDKEEAVMTKVIIICQMMLRVSANTYFKLDSVQ